MALTVTVHGTGPIDFRPAFAQIVKVIREATRQNFLGSHDPEGRRWEDVTEYTLRHRENPDSDDRPLIDEGYLMTAAVTAPGVLMTDKSLRYQVVGIPYAGRHEHGGFSEGGYRVPQRKFLGWNRKMVEEAKQIVARHAAAALRGRRK